MAILKFKPSVEITQRTNADYLLVQGCSVKVPREQPERHQVSYLVTLHPNQFNSNFNTSNLPYSLSLSTSISLLNSVQLSNYLCLFLSFSLSNSLFVDKLHESINCYQSKLRITGYKIYVNMVSKQLAKTTL